MKSMIKIFDQISTGALTLTFANISGPVQIDSLDECIKCYNGDYTWVCSVDGAAFCCELGDHHSNCNCFGNELEDLMYCPNEAESCGQTDITLSNDDEGKNITIFKNQFNPLCIY